LIEFTLMKTNAGSMRELGSVAEAGGIVTTSSSLSKRNKKAFD